MSATELLWSAFLICFIVKNGKAYETNLQISYSLPHFNITFQDGFPRLFNGARHIFIRKLNKHTIQFDMKKHFEFCCYRFIHNSEKIYDGDKGINFSKCKRFKDKSNVTLLHDFINVKCIMSKTCIMYDDYYALTNYIYKEREPRDQEPPAPKNYTVPDYNVLILGIGGMYRARVKNSLRKTTSYLNKNDWLDFRGYSKISKDSVPNLMAILAGRNESLATNKTCFMDMSLCNQMLIWNEFKKLGYVTAYGEDAIHGSNTFQKYNSRGFSVSPTDHYMTPFFVALSEEQKFLKNNTADIPSSIQILNYMLDFSNTYKDDKFFGFFWISSINDEDTGRTAKSFDISLTYFFEKLRETGVLANTFIIFLSDRGVNIGNTPYSLGAYSEEKMPMLYMHAPDDFRKNYKYSNLESNQFHLTSHYDLHLTLWDILKMSNKEITAPIPHGCMTCTSLFKNIPDNRECYGAGVRDDWCF